MSSRAAPRDSLTALIDPVVTAAGFDLEDLVVTPAGRRSLVRVVIDADGGVTLDDVAEVSRALSAALDDHDSAVMGASPYVLEVSSPGVDRPLTLQRHWRRAVGRLVSVGLVASADAAAETVRGRVLDCDEAGVALEVNGVRRELAYPQIRTAKVEVEFNRPSANRAAEQAGEEES